MIQVTRDQARDRLYEAMWERENRDGSIDAVIAAMETFIVVCSGGIVKE